MRKAIIPFLAAVFIALGYLPSNCAERGDAWGTGTRRAASADSKNSDEFLNAALRLIKENHLKEISPEICRNVLKKLVLTTLANCFDDVPIDEYGDNPEQCFAPALRSASSRCGLNYERLTFNTLNYILQELDPNSCMLDAAMVKEIKIGTSGKFGGIGMVVSPRDQNYVAVSCFEGSPAHQAGIKAGDTILEIDGRSVHGLSLEDVLRKVRGPAGSMITLKVSGKSNGKERTVSIRRRIIQIPPVRFELISDEIGYIRIVNFQHNTARQVAVSLARVNANHLRGIILDLRDNPGGLFDEAIRTSDLFLKSGIITSLQSRSRSAGRVFRASGDSEGLACPVAILINKGTASASEILAGSMQGRPEVLVMGERSFGKASVQSIFTLRPDFALRITSGHYLTADGRDIDGKGLEPDIFLERNDDFGLVPAETATLNTDPWIAKAIDHLISPVASARLPFSTWY